MTRYPPLGQLGPRAIAAWAIRTQTVHVDVAGLTNIPAAGPVMLVARHFHHLLDGSVLVTRVARPIHIVVGLDWATTPLVRRWMERVCRAAEYPIVLRAPTLELTGSYRREELVRFTRRALRETTRLLRAGRVVLVFPEGYPTIDPTGPGKPDVDAWLPFASGFMTMIDHAERDRRTHVAVVPVGFHYEHRMHERRERWSITARIGPPIERNVREPAHIEAVVKALSLAVPPAARSAAADESEHYQ